MAYLALYREWRPRTFSEVVGQEHVVRTLSNALKGGRPSHAYLFCGPRGTGKTSIAKILARAVNCQAPGVQGSPCGQCQSCLDIDAGTSMDVTEIDAASNRGIDEVRDLREKIKFAPSAGKYRVFIVDEVHMLTNEAFNALLKTLEEPPGHAMFILATTEPHRVPLTILSRCQRFDFHRIGGEEMAARIREVARGAGIEADEESVALIVRAADGGMRDALGILDQAAAYSGNRVGVEEIHRILGTVREDLLDAAAGGIIAGRPGEVLNLIGEISDQGKDLRIFAKDLNARLRRELLDRMSPPGRDIDGIDRLCRIMERLAGAEQEMRWSSQPRVLLEVAVVRASRTMAAGGTAAGGDRLGEMEARLRELEGRLVGMGGRPASGAGPDLPVSPTAAVRQKAGYSKKAAGAEGVSRPTEPGGKKNVVSVAPGPRPAGNSAGELADPGIKYGVKEKETGPGASRDVIFSKIDSRWDDLLEKARKVYPHIATHLVQGKGWPLEIDGKTLTIAFPRSESYTPLAMGILQDDINIKELADLIKSVCKEDLRVRLVESDRKSPRTSGSKKATVQPDDVEALFGKAGDVEDVPEGDLDIFDT